MEQQRAKERACHLAIQRGMALFTRGHQVIGVHADGSVVLVCGNRNVAELWPKAASILHADRQRYTSGSPFRLMTPQGLFEGETLGGLLWRWLCGNSQPLPPSSDGQVG